jgi:hypothetical protein
MKIIYSESACNSASCANRKKERVHEYHVVSQMKQPVIIPFVSDSVHHYNSNSEQN